MEKFSKWFSGQRGLTQKILNAKKKVIYYLLTKLSQYIAPNPWPQNMITITADKKLAATLWYQGDTSSMKMTANLFGIYQSTLSNFVIEVSNTICR